MKTLKNKIFALALALMLALSFVACNVNVNLGENTKDLSSSEQSVNWQTTEVKIDNNDNYTESKSEESSENNDAKKPVSINWLSYVIDVEVAEEAPPGNVKEPVGKYAHIILNYVSDDNTGYGGFRYEDLKNATYTATDKSNNIYEHIGVFNPVAIEMVDSAMGVAELQQNLGVFFDIPTDIQLNDLTFYIDDVSVSLSGYAN